MWDVNFDPCFNLRSLSCSEQDVGATKLRSTWRGKNSIKSIADDKYFDSFFIGKIVWKTCFELKPGENS